MDELHEMFSVDTHLFRELGELLVGRDSTALVELVKNAYDADATRLLLYARNLDDPRVGLIQLVDNGNGMRLDQFRRGFLRIASRNKQFGGRHSSLYGRQFTGAKGIGRLAAHKLAHQLALNTTAATDSWASPQEIDSRLRERAEAGKETLQALLDWDVIERYETLAEVREGLEVSRTSASPGSPLGTSIELRKLRRRWTSTDLGLLVRQVRGFGPPQEFVARLPRTIMPEPLLFDVPLVRENEPSDPGFIVDLEGEFDVGEEHWSQAMASATWVIEVDARPSGVEVAMAPTRHGSEQLPEAAPARFQASHDRPNDGPFFNARVFVREGTQGTVIQRAWMAENGGVRVYLEGFRVLPYGEPRDDWLSIDFEYSRRVAPTRLDPTVRVVAGDLAFTSDLSSQDQVAPATRNVFGAVFLTERRAPGLRSLVNREGFVPDENFEELIRIIRLAIDLNTRVRARYTAGRREERRRMRAASSRLDREASDETQNGDPNRDTSRGFESETNSDPSTDTVEPEAQTNIPPTSVGSALSLGRALDAAWNASSDAERYMHGQDRDRSLFEITRSLQALKEARRSADRLADDVADLRVLATVGTQLSAFVHEIQSLLTQVKTTEEALAHVRSAGVVELRTLLADVRRGLERQASYLVDVVSPDSRRRRRRQRVRDRLEAAVKLVAPAADRRGITIINGIPENLTTPPMFPSEVIAVLVNLLTNAVKAAGDDGSIHASAQMQGDFVHIRLENTGTTVDLSDSERWFEPYESTTVDVDPILGQGMGLGLPITRALLAEYRGSIKFVPPSAGFATAVEIMLPD